MTHAKRTPMTPVSMMPPVDYCPSCEGKKAEARAIDIAQDRLQQADLKAEQQTAEHAPSPGEPSAAAGTTPVSGAVTPLVSPDLAVQAMLAKPEIDAGNDRSAATDPPIVSNQTTDSDQASSKTQTAGNNQASSNHQAESGEAAARRLLAADAYRGG